MFKRLIAGAMTLLFSACTFATTTGAAAPAKHASIGSMIWLPLILIAIFYFLIIRPQSKRQREHKELISKIGIGDEVVTNAGILGKILRLRDAYIVISVSKDSELTISRSAIAQILPKGTIDGVN